MPADHDPALLMARATDSLTRTMRGMAWMQGLALAFLGVSLVGLALLLWLTIGTMHEHAVHTQALLALLERLR